MAHTMSKTQALAFISELPARTAKLATVRADGSPHVAPVWVALDGDRLVFTTSADTMKGKAVKRDPRVALSFDDQLPPFSFVVYEGEAEIVDDRDALLRWATTIAGRYMGDDLAEQYGRRNAVEGELLVRVTPTRLIGIAAIAD
jgi:PPOX class probable F420-dependent enzyme